MRLPDSAERVVMMVRKELQQCFRDPRMLRVIFVAPVVQLVVFGYAVSTDVRHTPTIVVDHDRTRISRELVDVLTASGYFEVVARAERSGDLVDALDHGRATVGVEIPAGFARDFETGAGAKVQFLLDGTNSNTALVAQGYAERIVQSWAARVAPVAAPTAAAGGSGAASGSTERVPPRAGVELRERAWFNPELESRNYNVPAVVGAIILLVCQLLTALAVVREREIGTLEQLMVSPLRAAELIAGKTIPFALLGLFDLVIVTTVARLWFHVPFEGSAILYVAASLLFLLSGLGLGLLLSTVSSTQQEAFMGSFLLFMPTMLLSGFLFPVSSMPRVFQVVTLFNPLRHYLEIVRGIFLKGAGVEAFWPQLLALAVMGAAVLAFAATRFHKRIG
jgi:ABC-2 type transport system permease protein